MLSLISDDSKVFVTIYFICFTFTFFGARILHTLYSVLFPESIKQIYIDFIMSRTSDLSLNSKCYFTIWSLLTSFCLFHEHIFSSLLLRHGLSRCVNLIINLVIIYTLGSNLHQLVNCSSSSLSYIPFFFIHSLNSSSYIVPFIYF
jgi:hypothetical protein